MPKVARRPAITKKSTNKATAKPRKAAIKVTPVRLEPELRRGLVLLQTVLKMPMNKLINRAVDDFIMRRTARVETDLEAVLKQVKAYRKRDPKFKQAVRRTARTEARAAKDDVPDPAQGTPYLLRERKETGAAQSMVRHLLGGR